MNNKTERLVKVADFANAHLKGAAEKYPDPQHDATYRWQHTLRVSNYGKIIAEAERADAEAGQRLLKTYEWVSRLCDRCLFALVKEEDKTVRAGDAASLALYFRWLKRINSHLRNITTSVVNPFDRIGFEPRRTKS